MSGAITFPSTTSSHLLPLLFPGQAQKELSLNHSITVIDSLLSGGVIAVQSSPPASPIDGAMYLIDESANGDWQGKDNQIAIAISTGWHFIEPYVGMNVFNLALGATLHFDGIWQIAQVPNAPSGGATTDQEARDAIVGVIDALRSIGLFQ